MSGVDIITVDPNYVLDDDLCELSGSTECKGSVVICNVKMDEQDDLSCSEDNTDLPPSKSRYGRKLKPKIAEDFLSTDRKISTILGISPIKFNQLPCNNNNSTNNLKEVIKTRNSKRINKGLLNGNKSESQSESEEEFPEPVKTRARTKEKVAYNSDDSEDSDDDPFLMKRPKSILLDQQDEEHFQNSWLVGDLLWGRLPGSPFWPCIIIVDPKVGKYMKTKVSEGIERSVHVQFFGDINRRGWLFTSAIAPFEGREAFAALAIKVSAEARQNNKKSLSAFTISTKDKPKWDRSVEEAQEFILYSRKERMKLFFSKYTPIESSDEEDENAFKTEETEKSEKLEKETRRSKLENTEKSEKEPTRKSKIEITDKLEKETRRNKIGNTEKSEKETTRRSKIENTEKTEKELTTRRSKIENTEKQEKSEKETRSKIENTEKQEKETRSKIENAEKSEKNETDTRKRKIENSEKSEKTETESRKRKKDNSEKSEKSEKETRSKLENTEKIEKFEKETRRNKIENSEKLEKTETESRKRKIENTEKSEKFDKSQKKIRSELLEESSVLSPELEPDARSEPQLQLQPLTSTPKKKKKKKSAGNNSSPPVGPIVIDNELVNEYLPSPERRKQLSKKYGEEFNLFLPENIAVLLAMCGDFTPKDCEQLSVKSWIKFTPAQKAHYKRKVSSQDISDDDLSSLDNPSFELSEESGLEELEDEISQTDEQTQLDEEPAGKTKRTSATREKKPGGIFKGIKASRVCDTCEKPGADVRCRGPCLSAHHIECLDLDSRIRYTDYLKSSQEILSKKLKLNQSNNKNEKTSDEKENEDFLCREFKEDEDDKSSSTSVSLVGNSKKRRKRNEIYEEYRCKQCEDGVAPPCFICNQSEHPSNGNSTRLKCSLRFCGKFYHQDCISKWPSWTRGQQTNGDPSKAICPCHVCHTCANEDFLSRTNRLSSNDRLVRCVRCPTAYHTGNHCIPAGTMVLTSSQIICPKHYKPPKKGNHHVNTAWCFLCSMGGSLICCDLCPTSFHADCLKLQSPPEGSYICDDCEAGRFPLYGEIVWVKLGSYRWWPAQALFPNQIPDNVSNIPHQLGEFAVKFFGSHDYYWVSRGRVFLYQEGDSAHNKTKKTTVDGVFLRALAEANEAHNKFTEEKRSRNKETRFGDHPPKYIKIKSNKPYGNIKTCEADTSTITPCECNPNLSNPCGPDSDCLNRILLVECNSTTCPAGDRCGNQQFDKRIYPPLKPYRTESRGWGLKSLEKITKGQFVIEYVGEIIDEAEYRRRLERMHREKDENYYFLTIDRDRLIDAGPKGNLARFMNHSCDPNCETQKWTVNGDTRVGLFALKDIEAGTELTFNYMLECSGQHKKPCMCGASNCSGFIGAKVNKQEKTNKNGKSEIEETGKKTKSISREREFKEKRIKIRKKRNRLLKAKPIQKSDTECFICGKRGELLLCDNKTCPKSYHLSCLQLKAWPDGKWLCPWHRCDKCNKRTMTRCTICPSAFCTKHAKSNIEFNDLTKTWLCNKHFNNRSNQETSNNGIPSDKEENIESVETKADKATSGASVSVIDADAEDKMSETDSDRGSEQEEDDTFFEKVEELTKVNPPTRKRRRISKKIRKVKRTTRNRKTFPVKSTRVRVLPQNMKKPLLRVKMLTPLQEDDTIENDVKIINSLKSSDLALVSTILDTKMKNSTS